MKVLVLTLSLCLCLMNHAVADIGAEIRLGPNPFVDRNEPKARANFMKLLNKGGVKIYRLQKDKILGVLKKPKIIPLDWIALEAQLTGYLTYYENRGYPFAGFSEMAVD